MTTEPGRTPSGPEPHAPDVVEDASWAYDEVDVERLIRLGVIALLGTAAVCALGGVVWGVVVPGVTGVVVSPGQAGSLGGDTGHRFDAVATYACISFVAGVTGGVGAWGLRALRGPAGAVATAVGAATGSSIGIWVGGLLAGARHPGPGATAVGQFFQSAPSLRLSGAALEGTGGFVWTWAIVVIAPIGGLIAYLVLMLAVRRPDLAVARSGGRPQGGELVGDP